MNIFFDVDATIVSDNYTLRPYVREIFEKLIGQGHNLYIWSGVGIRWEIVDMHKLRPYIQGCYRKPLNDHHNSLKPLGVPVVPDFCVDDHWEIIEAFGGVKVNPYFLPKADDVEMLRVYEAVANHHSKAEGLNHEGP